MCNEREGSTVAIRNTSTFDFYEATRYFLDQYGVDVYGEVYEAIDEVRKETVSKLREASSAAFGKGKYAKGWASKMERARVRATAVVYGKSPTYALAHLLEFGHVTRNGTGRTFKDTPAHSHIAAVNEWAQDEAIDRTVSKLEKRQ